MQDNHKFQNLRYKIFGETDKQIAAILKPLEKYTAIKKLSTNPQFIPIVKYLIYLYDPKTDLNLEYVRLEERIDKAAELSGLDKHQSVLTEITTYKNSEVLDVIQVLLTQVFHDVEYREWQTLHKELDEYTKARWEPSDITKKTGIEAKAILRKECQNIIDQIKQLEQSVFGDHVGLKEIAYKSRFINPESFAKAARIV